MSFPAQAKARNPLHLPVFPKVPGRGSGAAKRLKTEVGKDGAHLPVFLASRNLLPYVSKDLMEGPLRPITCRSGDGDVEGYAAEALPENCHGKSKAGKDERGPEDIMH